jgi:beta-glucosidase
VQAFYPGAQGGNAIARMLFGDVNPQGKLPVTFYRTDEELPAFTDYSMKGRTYRYMEREALYPFGYGLSYTRFALGEATLQGSIDDAGVDISVPLRNVGDRSGSETVQVYVKADRPGTPNAQLKALKKVALQPGEEATVALHLPLSAFALCDETGTAVVEPGSYTVYIGTAQPDRRSEQLTGTKAQERTLLTEERRVIVR